MKKHIVFIWELGDNFGHIATFSGLAKRLHKRGYRLTAILQNLAEAPRFFEHIPIQLLQAPVWKKQPLPIRPQTYTDDIRNCGYMNMHGLQGLLRGWQSLYALLKPDMVIFNSAPTAMAAAKNAHFKKVAIGHGYEIPPHETPLPAFRAADEQDMDALATREKEVLNILNAALKALDMSPYRHFHEVLKADIEFLSCASELDHYPQRKKADYVGALSYTDGGTAVKWPSSKGKRIFAYIRPGNRFFVSTMQALHALSKEHAVIVSAPGLSQKNIDTLSTKTMIIVPSAVHIASIREQCDLAICHAGIGTVSAFLLAGVPLLLLPNHVEQWMMAQNVLRLGAGAMPKGAPTQKLMQTAIKTMLARPVFKEKAQLFQKKYAGFSNEKAETYMVKEIEKLLTGNATRIPRSRNK